MDGQFRHFCGGLIHQEEYVWARSNHLSLFRPRQIPLKTDGSNAICRHFAIELGELPGFL